ncbi:MAG: flagellar basal body L-ring protein FlgH [Armatimonadota bacterium]
MRAWIVLACMALPVCGRAVADSLWSDSAKSLFADRKARTVGDIVTVVVVESTTSSQSASTSGDSTVKTSSSSAAGPLKILPKLSFDGQDTMESKGSTSRSATLTARIAARVVRILPNGDLEIEGARVVTTNGEKQELKLRGVVRPEDIAPDNTVLSTFVANAEITYTGKGTVGVRQRMGIITRLVRLIW